MGFLIHAKRIIEMLDVALDMMGPKQDLLTETLRQLGARHAHHGVKEEFFPILGEALKDALSEATGDKWTYEVEEAWDIVYEEMSRDIIKGMR
jgi:hemoglobin-like flavoprotein